MAAGDPFSSSERAALDEAMRQAEQRCRAEFSVFVGASHGDPRAFATSLHNSLVAPSRSVLIMVDPSARAVEVVTGGHVRQELTDHEVELAVASMQNDFAAGDLAGGLRRGITMLADHAVPLPSRHGEDDD
ncbi:DUF5130 family protein [Nocardioides nanhaiensis]|uniref:DUF5130 family protein n=1 Tax=Nocardioides nanhaiensis TaxID=1476871 RepID=A0ABP8W3S5_9ACTN